MPMKSIKDVAELAGVSIATVSRYLNAPEQVRSKTAERVAKAIAATGYAPNNLARNFRLGRTQQIMVVIPSVGVPFFEPVMSGIRKEAEAANYHLLVMESGNIDRDFDEFSRMVMSKQCDGILLLSTFSPFEDPNINASEGHPPIVLCLENIAPELANFPSVRIDNFKAAQDVVNYLYHLGHRDIALMYGAPHPGSQLTMERKRGFCETMQSLGLEVRAGWLQDDDLSLDGGRRALREVLKAGRPTAVFCANDELALGAIFEIKQQGLRVPEDISVVGFDNMRFTEVCDPPLTTVEQPAEAIGQRAMQRLLLSIEGREDNAGVEILEHRLVERASVAKLRR